MINVRMFPRRKLRNIRVELLPFLGLERSLFRLLGLYVVRTMFLDDDGPAISLFALQCMRISL